MLTTAERRAVEVDNGVLVDDVDSGTTDGDPEVVVGLAVEDTGVVEGTDEHGSEGEADGSDVVTEEDSGGLDADLDIVAAVLASVDGVCKVRDPIEDCKNKRKVCEVMSAIGVQSGRGQRG